MRLSLASKLSCVACLVGIAVAPTGCGNSGAGTSDDQIITVGTTDVVASLDPAKGYGSGDVAIMNSVFQTLLHTPPGKSEPVPQLAKKCAFDGPKTYRCALKTGLKFSNGQSLTAADVKYSFDRTVRIDDSAGGAYLLEPLDRVETPSSSTVVFHLKRPTATWPLIIAGPYAAVVPKAVFPPDKLLSSDKVVGSGPYKLAKFEQGRNAVLKPNPRYTGEKPKNSGVTILYYQQPSAMRIALENGDLDTAIAWRSLSPTDLESIANKPDLEVTKVPGLDARYLAFNVKLAPGKAAAVRRAVAFSIDREAIAKNVYDGTVDPLYSVVPQGVPGATKAFADVYGTAPDKAKAEQLLKAAGLTTPVRIDAWYTPNHYGQTSADEWTEIARQLNGTGLFKVSVKSTEWQQYLDATSGDGSYPMYQAGWYPDYADADNFLSGLLNGGWITNYSNPRMKALLEKEQGSTVDSVREQATKETQMIAAKDAPVIPLYQGSYTMATQKNVTGVRDSITNLFLLDFARWGKS